MPVQDAPTLKSFFETGNVPTENSYIDLIDTMFDTVGGTPGAHHETHELGGTDVIQLDNLGLPDDNTDLNVTTSYHGLVPKLGGVSGSLLTRDASAAVWSSFSIVAGGAYTMTIPATGTVAMLEERNDFSVGQTISGTSDEIQLSVNGYTTQTDELLKLNRYDTLYNVASPVLNIYHLTTGTAAAGFGSQINWYAQDSSGSLVKQAYLNVYWDDAEHSTRTGNLNFYTSNGSGMTLQAQIGQDNGLWARRLTINGTFPSWLNGVFYGVANYSSYVANSIGYWFYTTLTGDSYNINVTSAYCYASVQGSNITGSLVGGSFSVVNYNSTSSPNLTGGVFAASAGDGITSTHQYMWGGQFLVDAEDSSVNYAYSIQFSAPHVDTGSIGTGYALFIGSPTRGTGNYNYLYGLYIQDMSVADVVNYAIYTNDGEVHFGDYTTITRTTGEQLSLFYDATHYATFEVALNGQLYVRPSGNLVLDPTGNDVVPYLPYDINLGTLTKPFLTLHAAELYVNNLVVDNIMATIGGHILVGPTTTLIADVDESDTTIDVEHNMIQNGDILRIEADMVVEFMQATSGPTAISGGYRYSVTRGLSPDGANSWSKGESVFDRGQTGNGFIELYAVRGIWDAYGPTMVGWVNNSNTYNDTTEHFALGNLNGVYGYSSDMYGMGIGRFDYTYITVEETNGIRMVNDSVVRFEISTTGYVYIRNGSGTPVFTFDSDAGEFTLPLSLGVNGGIWQGSSGTFSVPDSGLKIWRDSSTGMGLIAGYYGGTEQWYVSTIGQLMAGSGAVWLDEDGISIQTDDSIMQLNAYKFVDGSTVIGGMYVRKVSSTEYYIQIENNIIPGGKGYIGIGSWGDSGQTGTISISTGSGGYNTEVQMVSNGTSGFSYIAIMDAPLVIGSIGVISGVDGELYVNSGARIKNGLYIGSYLVSPNQTDGSVYPGLFVGDPDDETKWVGIGYDDDGDFGFIYSVDHTTAWKPLYLNPSGGDVYTGASLNVASNISIAGMVTGDLTVEVDTNIGGGLCVGSVSPDPTPGTIIVQNASDPYLRIRETATTTCYANIQNVGYNQSYFQHVSTTSSDLLIDAVSGSGSASSIRFGRLTSTTGSVTYEFIAGDGTSAQSAIIYGGVSGSSTVGDMRLAGGLTVGSLSLNPPQGYIYAYNPSSAAYVIAEGYGATSAQMAMCAGNGVGYVGTINNYAWQIIANWTTVVNVYSTGFYLNVPQRTYYNDSGTGNAPTMLEFRHRTTATPALGFGNTMMWSADGSVGTDRWQASIQSYWRDSGANNGGMRFYTYYNNSATEIFRMENNTGSGLWGFFGAAAAQNTGWSVSYTARKTLTSSTATTQQTAEMLCTLVQVLLNHGILHS